MSIASFGTPERARTQDLDALPWLTQSPTYSALGWTFQLRSTDAELGHHLERILRPLRSPVEAACERVHVYSFIADGIAGGSAGAVYLDQDKLRWSPSPDVLLRLLIWHINQSAIRVGGLEHVLLHAGVVELHGRGVLLVAPEDHGKTTLTAALVRDGFGYLSDEVAAIDPRSLVVRAYPKSLSLDPGSWTVHAALAPEVPDSVSAFARSQWQVPAEDIRPGSARAEVEPTVIVLPRYTPGQPTAMRAIPRAEAMLLMAQQCFTWAEAAPRSFHTLARLLRRTSVFRMDVSCLDEASARIRAEVDRT